MIKIILCQPEAITSRTLYPYLKKGNSKKTPGLKQNYVIRLEGKNFHSSLIHFSLMFHFYTPWGFRGYRNGILS